MEGNAKQDKSLKELYKLFESRSGVMPQKASVSPSEFANELASEFIKKIDEEVKIK